ncbi:MAG TPA: hypothetical protein VFB62_08300 [Polyangiaceae bacterium]|nr:hypothetical protein [Polyangiaceae bacterium]
MRWLLALLVTTGCSDLLGLDDYQQQAAATVVGSGGSGSGGESAGGGGSAGGAFPVQCNGNPLLRDAFDRTVPEGWGIPDEGMAWTTNDDSETSVADGSGAIHVVNSNGRAALVVDTATDVEMVGTVRWAIPSGSFTVMMGGLLLRSNFTNYIQLNIHHSPTQTPVLALAYTTPADSTLLEQVDLPNGGWSEEGYYMRFQVFGENPATLRARVWPRSEAEPAQWHIDVMNSDVDLPQAGGYGAQAYTEDNAAGVTVFYDDFTVCSK